MAKTTLIQETVFSKKVADFVFDKIVVLNKADQFPLKKFNFSMTVFQTSMKMLKKTQKLKAVKIKIESKNC